VRPHLEFAVAAWNPHFRKDIAVLEKVQHRATKVASDFRSLKYEERCNKLGLTSLVSRRVRGDMIQQFKILNGMDKVQWVKEPIVVEGRVGKREQLRREVVLSCAQRHNFFTNRIVNNWNKLKDETASAQSIASFKLQFDKREVATL